MVNIKMEQENEEGSLDLTTYNYKQITTSVSLAREKPNFNKEAGYMIGRKISTSMSKGCVCQYS